jgi:hypothetical protein
LFDLYLSNEKGSVKITEQELMKLITRTLVELKKIDKTEFDNLTTTPPTTPSAITINYDANTATDAGDIQTKLATLITHAGNLVETTDRHTGRKEYSFGHNFVRDDGSIPATFGKTDIETYFQVMT